MKLKINFIRSELSKLLYERARGSGQLGVEARARAFSTGCAKRPMVPKRFPRCLDTPPLAETDGVGRLCTHRRPVERCNKLVSFAGSRGGQLRRAQRLVHPLRVGHDAGERPLQIMDVPRARHALRDDAAPGTRVAPEVLSSSSRRRRAARSLHRRPDNGRSRPAGPLPRCLRRQPRECSGS